MKPVVTPAGAGYLERLIRLIAVRKRPPRVTIAEVQHEPFCLKPVTGAPCSCTPTIVLHDPEDAS